MHTQVSIQAVAVALKTTQLAAEAGMGKQVASTSAVEAVEGASAGMGSGPLLALALQMSAASTGLAAVMGDRAAGRVAQVL